MKPLKAGTSGFRGLTGIDITTAHAEAIGRRYGLWLRQTGEAPPVVMVGHDQRLGARELAGAVMRGLQQVGVHAIDTGMMSTGLFTFAMWINELEAGILVTGSHMKHNRIGIIPMNGDGTYCTSEVTGFIEEGFADPHKDGGDFVALGKYYTENGYQMMQRYIAHLKSFINSDLIGKGRFHIVFDAGNGTTGELAMLVFGAFGVRLSCLFNEPREVPERPSECTPENCVEAIAMTASTRFANRNLGVALDGDGDRSMFISPTKGALDGDVVAGIFARDVLGMDDICVTPVTSGALTAELCRQVDARVEYCRVGQPDTGRAVKDHGATFYHEAASNKFGWSKFSLGYDALYATLKMLEIMARRQMTLDELVEELPVFHRKDTKVEFEDFDPEFCRKAVADAMRQARFAFASFIGGGECEVIDIDGLRVNFPDGSWLLLRPSGTEPLARVYAGGEDLALVEELVDTAVEIFRRHLGLTE